MLLSIPDVLDRETLERVQRLLEGAQFVDGKLSAGTAAARVKANEEVSSDAAQLSQLNHIVMGRLVNHAVYQRATLPLRVATPFYARYLPGMRYGDHVDDPVMGAPDRYRSDISITVFLNAPEDYDGGELVIQTAFGDREVKLPAGHAVLYPSSSRHRIAEVTRGTRLVAVTWVQSMVRDPERRALLFELSEARETLLRDDAEAAATKQVDKAYVNLLRMWAEV
jgi:PKHD-type hydroxylase